MKKNSLTLLQPPDLTTLALLSALWAVIEIVAGFTLQAWNIPFRGSVLAAISVGILIVGRVSVPKPGTAVMMGLIVSFLKIIHLGGVAIYPLIAIVAESTLVELALWKARPQQWRYRLAGALALIWALIHPFLAQGLLAGWGVLKVYALLVERGAVLVGTRQGAVVIAFLLGVHVGIGIVAGWYAERFTHMLTNRIRGAAVLPEGIRSPVLTARRHQIDLS
ncbi:MAG: hypothetical protein ONB44_22265 [candidate division KSB1 bacterium]|nr:hypothetical protein [candidate division KSB1 bacterium]MDZ7304862.1 hypothetical protein [candidate division KSB1 bacterium]MDZ7314115.1 hypothetical protein [candidate division KSB1 bacterium]